MTSLSVMRAPLKLAKLEPAAAMAVRLTHTTTTDMGQKSSVPGEASHISWHVLITMFSSPRRVPRLHTFQGGLQAEQGGVGPRKGGRSRQLGQKGGSLSCQDL